ncbi:MAG: NADH-quinone oxidoreductase subunit J [Paludibacterium sp.]|uniref:NADH-quinone oxidoreductase subunit J n=1 Tax=Paludibacterium sp. TaxID=1917523 RepID=UPI0026005DAC|nr:NADH-quinone oxidoreductase subunit J [Paludibacterium sp.]MBV8047964.1 NADH-quinone oxidoreductase subunit J [Paludibacterium sp.]MBV8649132.1 NADH-quinone oxidoreductase subunit J [Paludibacterium sp.]
MSFTTAVFYILSAILLAAAFRVITAKNPVHAALFLVLSFFSAAGLWVLLESEFLAISLVLVYVGAVMVLFLFVVMMLDIDIEKLREGFWKHFPLAGTIAIIMAGEMALILGSPEAGLKTYPARAPLAADFSNVRELGVQMYTHYMFATELASVVLLLAIVAAIALTQRTRKESKALNVGDQVAVRAADRVRVVKMAATPVETVEAAEDQPQA